MIWQLLAALFGGTTFALSAIAIWQAGERARLRKRFAGVIDVEREINARRHAFNVELSRRQIVFDSEISARRRAIESELAKQTAELEGRRRNPSAVAN